MNSNGESADSSEMEITPDVPSLYDTKNRSRRKSTLAPLKTSIKVGGSEVFSAGESNDEGQLGVGDGLIVQCD